jgi:hypothetical protein
MTDRSLNPKILEYLEKKTKKSKGTIRKDISILRRSFGNLPINTVAQIYAIKNSTSVVTKLTKEERKQLPNFDIEKGVKVTQKSHKSRQQRKIIQFIKYETNDSFIKAHVLETNKAYTNTCYTAAFILCRKIIENLLTDIIRKKYTQNSKENIELHFDTKRRRNKDFSEILTNLGKRSNDFGADRTLLDRILSTSRTFKDDANNKTHSWYHIVRSKKEIDDHNVQDIIDMIITLENNMSTI